MTTVKLQRLRYLFGLLLVLALLPQTAGQSAFAWFCEGRVCGVTPSYCCCTSPDSETRDLQCGKASPTNGMPPTAMCSSACECQMMALRSADDPFVRVASAPAPPTPFLAVLPSSVHLPAPVQIGLGAQTRNTEVRGPPSLSACFPAHSLRAPPHS
jgi:hypothetical protein